MVYVEWRSKMTHSQTSHAKAWGFLLLVGMVLIVGCVEKKEVVCAYPTESECRNSINGYLQTYQWLDDWAKSCERDGKIFTVDKREGGYYLDPRCAIEKEVVNSSQD